MRILYGVTGEGLGHAMRSRVVADHLRTRGHAVKLVASDRACRYLRRYFDDVQTIPGFSIAYAGDGISRLRTVARNARATRPAIRESIALYRRAISGFAPDVCISDFDSFSHVFGLLFDRPVLSLDHQHVIDRCRHTPSVTALLRRRDLAITRAVVRAKLPGCRHYVITSFYFPAPQRERTTLVGPILRPEVIAREPTTGDHILVYQTAMATSQLLAALHAVPAMRFVVYARDAAPGRTRNVEVRAFHEERFLDDLASAAAVICNGGYTLMSEALYLGKPVLSLPLHRHGEQELNAAYLTALGFGRAARRVAPPLLADVMTQAAGPRIPCGNAAAFAAIDRLLQEVS